MMDEGGEVHNMATNVLGRLVQWGIILYGSHSRLIRFSYLALRVMARTCRRSCDEGERSVPHSKRCDTCDKCDECDKAVELS